LAIVDPSDPATQVISFILGGGGALPAHGERTGTRAVINTSPEPVTSNGPCPRWNRHRSLLLHMVSLSGGQVALVLFGAHGLAAAAGAANTQTHFRTAEEVSGDT
jgi:hypothetical protein